MSASTSTLRALAAIQREVLGFRFHYPLETIPEAGTAGSLRFYVYSENLFLENQILDDDGIPKKSYRLVGPQYNPLFVAWWGLHHLERFTRERDERHLETFHTQITWLAANAEEQTDGAVVWPCHFDWTEGRATLRSGWISAMYQGVVQSAMVRAFRLTGESRWLELAIAATRVFSIDMIQGGVRTREGDVILYEEYPAHPLPRVLDGFLFSLLGLHDVALESGDPYVRQLFDDGIAGLERHLLWWDYRGKWSWYGSHGYLCPPHYHMLNHSLLKLLHGLTGNERLGDTAAAWNPARLGKTDRAEIYLAFVTTKNVARLRLPNERPE